MDDVRDAVLIECLGQRLAVGDVAAHERDLGIRGKPDATVIVAEVEPDDVCSFSRELAAGPRADAAERTGDEEPLARAHGSM
jgi:hypothetical protein